jgi:flavin-dependent dehydrogenase
LKDLLVVGGGPAGLAAGIAAAGRGLSVTVLEGRRPPIDKACGEGLMPAGVRVLGRLGLRVAELGGRAFHGIRYVDGGDERHSATARFSAGAGLGLRRTRLHADLARRAESLGVDLHWSEPVRGLIAGGVRTDLGEYCARFVVGADGLHSRVREWAGFVARSGTPRRRGVRRHYRLQPWDDVVEVWWAEGAEAYVTPVSEECLRVALLTDDASVDYDGCLARFPALACRLRGASHASEDRGAGPFLLEVPHVVKGAIALTGDASGYVDPITGEGLGLAFRHAEVLALAVHSGDLTLYEREHRLAGTAHRRLTMLLLAVQRRPRLRRRVIRALSVAPLVFARALDAHNGSASWSGVLSAGVGRFTVSLVAGR